MSAEPPRYWRDPSRLHGDERVDAICDEARDEELRKLMPPDQRREGGLGPQPWERDRGEAFIVECGFADGYVDARLGRPLSPASRFVEANWQEANRKHFDAYREAYTASWTKQHKRGEAA